MLPTIYCVLDGTVQFHHNPSHNSDHTSITTHAEILLFEGLSSLYDVIVNLVVKYLEASISISRKIWQIGRFLEYKSAVETNTSRNRDEAILTSISNP